jgi:hypothetical protein
MLGSSSPSTGAADPHGYDGCCDACPCGERDADRWGEDRHHRDHRGDRQDQRQERHHRRDRHQGRHRDAGRQGHRQDEGHQSRHLGERQLRRTRRDDRRGHPWDGHQDRRHRQDPDVRHQGRRYERHQDHPCGHQESDGRRREAEESAYRLPTLVEHQEEAESDDPSSTSAGECQPIRSARLALREPQGRTALLRLERGQEPQLRLQQVLPERLQREPASSLVPEPGGVHRTTPAGDSAAYLAEADGPQLRSADASRSGVSWRSPDAQAQWAAQEKARARRPGRQVQGWALLRQEPLQPRALVSA